MHHLIPIYKGIVREFKEYLTKNGTANMQYVITLLGRIGKKEPVIFRNRHSAEQRIQERNRSNTSQLPHIEALSLTDPMRYVNL